MSRFRVLEVCTCVMRQSVTLSHEEVIRYLARRNCQLSVISEWMDSARRGDLMVDSSVAIVCVSGRRSVSTAIIKGLVALLSPNTGKTRRRTHAASPGV